MRNYPNWLDAFVSYASNLGEAPRRMYFWAGVSAIAGALRRKVWIDMRAFRWYCNMYIIFVAPPGIIAKSTTVDVAISLLRQVPGIKFGPDVVTWQSLVQAFADSAEGFEYDGAYHTMSAMTLEASEFGNLLDPQDREMIDIYVRLWDAKETPFEKKTKHSGNDTIQKPWINLVACTTPSWIAGNFPEYMIGGGFTSRCVFVFADKKVVYLPYPDEVAPLDYEDTKQRLVADLTHIATEIAGPVTISEEARVFGRAWYERHFKEIPPHLDPDRFGGYVARKQSLTHKLAMILSISRGDSRIITLDDLQTATIMVTDLEEDVSKVFSKIGQKENAATADRLVSFVKARGRVKYVDAFRFVHAQLPSLRDFEDIVAGCARAGMVKLEKIGDDVWLVATFGLTDVKSTVGE